MDILNIFLSQDSTLFNLYLFIFKLVFEFEFMSYGMPVKALIFLGYIANFIYLSLTNCFRKLLCGGRDIVYGGIKGGIF